MEIQILAKKSKDKHYKNIGQEYMDRISHYCSISLVEKIPDNKKDLYYIKVGTKNKIDSIEFAQKINSILTSGYSKICFVDDSVEEYDYEISLVDMNISQDMENILLLEQIYRTFKINNNETYHK